MSNFGDVGYATVNPKGKAANFMVVKFESWSVASGVITLGTLTPMALEGADSSVAIKEFNAGTDIAITNNHNWLNNFMDLGSAQTVAGVKTFSSLPATTAGNPVADNDIARKAYVDATATGTTNIDRTVVAGNAGETVAAGELLYFDTGANNEWMLADADTASTVENVILGIAQGAGTDGAAITGGILIKGLDSNQTGMTAGDVMYASDTAGAIASSAGTKEVAVGAAKSATELYFSPRFPQQLTEDEQDALVGTSGTPSASNKFVTADDATTAKTASKIARRDANGDVLVTTTPTSGDAAASKTYVDNQTVDGSMVVGTDTAATYFSWQSKITSSMLSANVNYTLSELGSYAFFDNDAAGAAMAQFEIMGNGTNNNFVSTSGKDLRVKFRARVVFGTADSSTIGFGIGSDAGIWTVASSTTTSNRIGFLFTDDGTVEAVNTQASTGKESTDISGSVTETNWNIYEIVWTVGTSVKFYVNGTLLATHTTNMPVNSVDEFSVGGDTGAGNDIYLSPVAFSIEQ